MDSKERYIAEAAEHGRCLESGDFEEGNAAFDRKLAALAELRGHADKGESVLGKLINHPNGWVKLSAATHLLPLQPQIAREVLEHLASGPQSEVEFNARMVLREWLAGRLNVP